MNQYRWQEPNPDPKIDAALKQLRQVENKPIWTEEDKAAVAKSLNILHKASNGEE